MDQFRNIGTTKTKMLVALARRREKRLAARSKLIPRVNGHNIVDWAPECPPEAQLAS